MTSSSEYAGFTTARSTAMVVGVSPMDTHTLRAVFLNNAIHCYEQNSQVRVCWVGDDAGDPFAHKFGDVGDITADEWTPTAAFSFWCSRRHDLAPFKFRVRIAGRMPSGGTGAYRIGIGHHSSLRTDIVTGSGEPNVAEVTGITSTTSAWLSLDRTVLTCDLPDVEEVRTGTFNAENGAQAVSVIVSRVGCQIWTRTSITTQKPRVTGLLIAEYVG